MLCVPCFIKGSPLSCLLHKGLLCRSVVACVSRKGLCLGRFYPVYLTQVSCLGLCDLQLERYQADVEQCRRTFLNAKARQEKAYLLAGAAKVR